MWSLRADSSVERGTKIMCAHGASPPLKSTEPANSRPPKESCQGCISHQFHADFVMIQSSQHGLEILIQPELSLPWLSWFLSTDARRWHQPLLTYGAHWKEVITTLQLVPVVLHPPHVVCIPLCRHGNPGCRDRALWAGRCSLCKDRRYNRVRGTNSVWMTAEWDLTLISCVMTEHNN